MTRTQTNEPEDERIYAWHKVAEHPFFASCYSEDGPLLDSMLRKLDSLKRPATLGRWVLDRYNAVNPENDPGYHARYEIGLNALTPLRALVEAIDSKEA